MYNMKKGKHENKIENSFFSIERQLERRRNDSLLFITNFGTKDFSNIVHSKNQNCDDATYVRVQQKLCFDKKWHLDRSFN